jgi:moderate conductance mechanosensitive channel
MRHLVDLIPLPRALAEAVLILGLFLTAIVVSRLAGLVAGWLVSRRAVQGEDAPADAVARLQQRETAASLTQTSVRYVAFGLALVLSVLILSGVRNVDTIAGGAFVAIVLGFAVQRVLWDVIAGLMMFFESWFEVGDLVSIEPWGLQGVVEEVSLRSVKLRSVHGEIIHVQNHQVLAARLIPRGVREVEIELFVNDLEAGTRLVERLARIVPLGPTQFIRAPQVVESEKLDEDFFRITATAAVAPGREWLAEDLLPKLARERTDGLIVHGPVVTPIDEQAATRFARAVWLGRGKRDVQEPLHRLRAVERRLRRSRASRG